MDSASDRQNETEPTESARPGKNTSADSTQAIHDPVVKRPLSWWVKNSSLKLQLVLLSVVVVTVFARVLPLEMQKRIINEAINFRDMELLLIYAGFYLAAVVTASGLKFLINYLQTKLGQKALADMRKQLYAYILTLPMGFFRKTQPGMVVSSLVTEVAPAGDFVGMAIAVPITNLLTLLAFGAYLFWLSPLMAVVSLAIYPIIVIILPKLQRRTNQANKERVNMTREISAKIGESVGGIHEIQGVGSFPLENSKFGRIVDMLYRIRMRWTMFKLGTKVFNNFFVNLAPFLLFILGGWLIIQGRFDLGALVAFLSAQEKLYEPWAELMEFYQVYQDATVRYKNTMEYFDVEPEHEIEPAQERDPITYEPTIDVSSLEFEVPGGIKLLSGVDMHLKSGEHLALIGFSGSGKSTLAACIGQLYAYTRGSVELGGNEVADLTKRDVVASVGIVPQKPFIFQGTIKENLLYACLSMLPKDAEPVEGENIPTLDDQIQVLQQVGIFVDVLRFGLNTVITYEGAERSAELETIVERVVRVRENFQRHHGKSLSDYVEFFDERKYLSYSTVASNIVFGSARDPEFAMDKLASNPFFKEFLDEAQLKTPLELLGAELAKQTVDILGNLPSEPVFFEQSPIQPEEFEDFRRIVEKLDKTMPHHLPREDRDKLLDLGLDFIPGRHTMIALSDMLEAMILQARMRFREKVEDERPGLFTFYRSDQFLYNQTILDNILFGRPTTESSVAQERIDQAMIQLLIEEDLLESIVELGMHYDVGTAGDKLSGGQRQKLAIARIFLKNPPILIMDEATSALDNTSQARIQSVLETAWKGRSTLIAVVHRLDIIKNYDKVAVMKAGKIVEFGKYEELMAKKGLLYELVHGKGNT